MWKNTGPGVAKTLPTQTLVSRQDNSSWTDGYGTLTENSKIRLFLGGFKQKTVP